jgi:hypothetical protein
VADNENTCHHSEEANGVRVGVEQVLDCLERLVVEELEQAHEAQKTQGLDNLHQHQHPSRFRIVVGLGSCSVLVHIVRVHLGVLEHVPVT